MDLIRIRNFIVCQGATGNVDAGIQAKGVHFFPLRTKALHQLTIVVVSSQLPARFGEMNGGYLLVKVRDVDDKKVMRHESAIEIEPNKTRRTKRSVFILESLVRFESPGEYFVIPTLDGVKPSYLSPWILSAEDL